MEKTQLRLEIVKICYKPHLAPSETVAIARTLEEYILERDPVKAAEPPTSQAQATPAPAEAAGGKNAARRGKAPAGNPSIFD